MYTLHKQSLIKLKRMNKQAVHYKIIEKLLRNLLQKVELKQKKMKQKKILDITFYEYKRTYCKVTFDEIKQHVEEYLEYI